MNRANFQAANQLISDGVEAVVADILGIPGENTNEIQYDFKRNGSIIRVCKGGADHAAFIYTKDHQHGGNAGGDQPYQLEQDAVIYSSDFTVVRYALKQGKNYVVNAHGTPIFVLKSDDLLNGDDDTDWDAANDNAEELARIIEAAPGSVYALDEEAAPAPQTSPRSDAPTAESQSLAAAFPMLAAALAYAERGWDVFPAPPGAKKSYKAAKHSNGAKWGKTRDPEQIRRDFQRWPEANVAIVTGAESGIFVVETDTKEGHAVDGDAALAKLEQQHGKLPDTRMAESPSGSKHRYYKHPGEDIKIVNSASKLGHGIDVRGDGGMVIAPPSMRGDGEYRWLNDNDIADAPQWLIDLVTAKGNGKGTDDVAKPPAQIEIAEAFKHLDPNKNIAAGIEYPTADIEEIRSAALAIPPSVITDEPNWMSFARALAWEAKMRPERSEALWEILDTVSRQAPKYNKDNNRAKFDRYIDEAGTGEKTNTIATLFFLAREHGWRSPAELRRRDEQIRENIKIGEDVTESLLPQIMTLKEMHERLVFVGSSGVVADIATKRVRQKEHAADEYAASKHTYTTEKDGKIKQEGGPALKYWIASKDRITVEVLAWVPGARVICQPPEGQGPAFNMWRGLSPMAYPEDWQERVTPFLEHVEYLVPISSERERFLQWLAHIVRCPEVLPHTSYLMITPVTGIGRNWMASVLVRALRGYVAAGVSLPELLDKGYTGRLSQKLLIIVDEAREGRGERRYERAERFKQLQTEEHRHINHKYGYQIVEKNCGRWLAFSNHWDAIPLDSTDRRDIVIANPTTRKPDAYYERLYGLLNDKDFIGSVRHWLETKDITAFRPGEHAPTNPAKLRALDEMMSETERAVAEFKEDCETELTSRDEIKKHVSHAITRNGNMFANVNDAHLTHAIRGAGMTNTGQRIKAYQKHNNNDVVEKRLTVVIVRGEWDVEVVKKADPRKILAAMGLGDWSPWKPKP